MSRPLVIRPRASSIAVLNPRPKQTLEAGTADQFLLVRRAVRRHILSDVNTKTDIPDKALLRRSHIPHNCYHDGFSTVPQGLLRLIFLFRERKKSSRLRACESSSAREIPPSPSRSAIRNELVPINYRAPSQRAGA
jgi:hypothetical protein